MQKLILKYGNKVSPNYFMLFVFFKTNGNWKLQLEREQRLSAKATFNSGISPNVLTYYVLSTVLFSKPLSLY